MSQRKILQMEAPLDLICARCEKVGVKVRVVFPVDVNVNGGIVSFASPDVKVPVQLECDHCGNHVNYGPVGQLDAGSLASHGDQEQ